MIIILLCVYFYMAFVTYFGVESALRYKTGKEKKGADDYIAALLLAILWPVSIPSRLVLLLFKE